MTADRVAQLMSVAGQQHGVLTTGQAATAGVSADQVKRLVRAGVLDRCDTGVLRIVGWPVTWEQRLSVACLRAGPEAVVSHRAAGRLWEIEGFDRAPVEISVPRGHRRRPRQGIVHELRDLDRRDLAWRSGWRVTNPARTIVDLGAMVSPEVVEVGVDDLLGRGLTTLDRVGETTERLGRPGRTGPATARQLLVARRELGGLTDSGFETRLLRILRLAGLPAPALQHVVSDTDGRFVMRLDAAYVDERVGIEADSERWHMDRRRFVADRTKRAAAESLGWRILAFTHHHLVHDESFVVATVSRTLEVAGSVGLGQSGHGSVR